MNDFDRLQDLGPPATLVKTASIAGDLARAVADMNHEPTEEQKKAGNYKKGHLVWRGLPLTIETAKGKCRSGVSKEGRPWRTKMTAHYGYIKRTESEADGDHLDIFLCDDHLDSDLVCIVNQTDPESGKFDEHKIILGCNSEDAARECYLSNYSKGWKGLDSIAVVTLDWFKHWMDHSDTSKPQENFREYVARLKTKKASADPLAQLKEDLEVEEAVEGAETADEKLRKRDTSQLAGGSVKFAISYRFKGDVQGVHLRATLHKLLEERGLKGLAYNNARTGDVLADIDGPDDQVNGVLDALKERMASNGRVHSFAAEPTRQRNIAGHHVSLGDSELNTMFDRQGFNGTWKWQGDPAAARRAYVQKRYRLQEDPKSHALVGDVPELAFQQLSGKEPIYHDQMVHPERFGGVSWIKPELPAPATPAVQNPSFEPKLASETLPTIWLVKRADRRGPFTVAVDLDGTIAEEGKFDAKKIGKPREDIKKWMKAFKDAGARIIIWTVRGDDATTKAYLKEHDLPYDYINENPDQPPNSSGKVYADVYWDNRAIDATDVDSGAEVIDRIEEKETEGERPSHGLTISHTIIRVLLAPDDILEEMAA